jgi:hypothetical protein
MTKFVITVLCIMLCLVGIAAPAASAAARLTTSSKTSLVSCLQQEYLMRDAYQSMAKAYPTLTAFGTVAKDEAAMIATLKNVFAKYKIAVPADTQASAAQTLAATATSISNADAVAINLEQSTATLMTQLSRTTDNGDVVNAVTLIRTASLGSHTTTFAAEQMGVSAPAPAPAPAQRIVSFTTSDSTSTFATLLADETVDVIEMAAGTYHLRFMVININRTRPVVVRPVAGATVILSGANLGTDPQFLFGDGSTAGNITMQGLIFDGFVLGQQGIVQALDTHDITLNDMVVRNSRANGTTAQPYHSWAIYLSSTSTLHSTNFTANRWTVDGSARGMSALQVYGGDHITANGWSVTNAYYAVYASSSRGPLTNFVIDGWTINGTGAPAWGTSNVSIAVENSSGRFSNMHATTSGTLLNVGSPRMTDGGGNSL